MLKDRLLKEVAAPLWYAAKNLVDIAVSEEALLAYVSIIFTAISFAVDCWDGGCDAVIWASTVLVGEAPAVEEVLVDETLYLSASGSVDHTPAEEVLDWWVSKAFDVFVAADVMVAEYWNTPILCGVGAPLTLAPYKKRKGIRLVKGRK